MTLASYRKRGIVVEAIRFLAPFHDNPGNRKEIIAVGAPVARSVTWSDEEGYELNLFVENGAATARVRAGDWIIKEPRGDGWYPCTAEDFEATYDPADETCDVEALRHQLDLAERALDVNEEEIARPTAELDEAKAALAELREQPLVVVDGLSDEVAAALAASDNETRPS